MLTLYDFELAPNPRRARVFLAEKNIDYKKVAINLRELEQFSDAFKAVNPRCTVPALVNEDGHCFADNASIAAYLEARFPEPPCWAARPKTRAMWRIGRRALSRMDLALWPRPFVTATRPWPSAGFRAHGLSNRFLHLPSEAYSARQPFSTI